jgi:hypothetical protein
MGSIFEYFGRKSMGGSKKTFVGRGSKNKRRTSRSLTKPARPQRARGSKSYSRG